MKVIKLDKRHKHTKHGFVSAIKFKTVSDRRIARIESYLREKYGTLPWRERDQVHHPWISYTSSTGSWRKNNRAYWVCVKNPVVLTMALLSVDLTNV